MKESNEEAIQNTKTSDFRLFLQTLYSQKTESNRRYSLRAFANYLDLDPGSLSEILKGNRPVTRKTIVKIGNRIGLSPDRISDFRPTRELEFETDEKTKNIEWQRIEIDEFAFISEWQYFAILNLSFVEGFQTEPSWIAKRLGISVTQVNIAIERLQRLNLLNIDDDGNWSISGGGYIDSITKGKSSPAVRKLQLQHLEIAKSKIETVPADKRDNTGVSFPIDLQDLPEAKKLISKFRNEMVSLISKGKQKTDVYQLSIAFFPLNERED